MGSCNICVSCGILSIIITMERIADNILCVCVQLSECRCDVGLSVRCFRLRSSKINVSTFED